MKLTLLLIAVLALSVPAIASAWHPVQYTYRSPESLGYRDPVPWIWQTQIVVPPPREGSYLDRQAKARAARQNIPAWWLNPAKGAGR